MKGDSGEFWMVCRRVGKTQSTTIHPSASGNLEDAKRKALASPPIDWFCRENDSYQQKIDFHDWFFKTPFLVPEVCPTVNNWLGGAEPEINTIIINNPAGAYCRIAGRRDPGSARCSVKFIGNSNWE